MDSPAAAADPVEIPASGQRHSPIRLVMVDDHEMVLHGIAAMLAHHRDRVEIAGTATNISDALAVTRRVRPDVVLSDLRLGKDSGLDLCRLLRKASADVRVVFLTVYDDEQYLYQALRAEASGYILKRVDGPQLVDHLEQVAAGEIVIDPMLAGRVALSAARLSAGEFWPGAHLGLTQRESEVLELLVASHSNRAIAARLVVSEDTVKTHVRSLYRKLEVSDRGGAIAVALREGLFA